MNRFQRKRSRWNRKLQKMKDTKYREQNLEMLKAVTLICKIALAKEGMRY